MPVVDKEAPMDRVSRIRRHLEDGWEPDLFSDDFVNKSPWHRQRFQPDSLFSEWRINVEDAIEEGDKVVVTWRLNGIWSRPFLGIKATNQPIELTGINIYRFEGDKIVETNGEFSLTSLAQQVLAGGVSMSECAQALQALARTNDPAEDAGPA